MYYIFSLSVIHYFSSFSFRHGGKSQNKSGAFLGWMRKQTPREETVARAEPAIKLYQNFVVHLYLLSCFCLLYLFFWEIDKIGYTRVVSEQNRVPFFPRRGALTYVCNTPPNRLLAPELTAPRVRAAPQTVFSAFEPSKRRQ